MNRLFFISLVRKLHQYFALIKKCIVNFFLGFRGGVITFCFEFRNRVRERQRDSEREEDRERDIERESNRERERESDRERE